MTTMNEILSAVVIGLIVGALARLVMPGRQSIGIIWTIIVGIVGAVVGNFIGESISPDGNMHWILSVLVAVGLLLLVTTVSGGRSRRLS